MCLVSPAEPRLFALPVCWDHVVLDDHVNLSLLLAVGEGRRPPSCSRPLDARIAVAASEDLRCLDRDLGVAVPAAVADPLSCSNTLRSDVLAGVGRCLLHGVILQILLAATVTIRHLPSCTLHWVTWDIVTARRKPGINLVLCIGPTSIGGCPHPNVVLGAVPAAVFVRDGLYAILHRDISAAVADRRGLGFCPACYSANAVHAITVILC
mmetsp:Transcript_103927/g.274743  ORF Transcript_103927/g.274743 Transcript_103927/m.274743 type:complete len:210 (+) Transcript_103927:888-1517(+)